MLFGVVFEPPLLEAPFDPPELVLWPPPPEVPSSEGETELPRSLPDPTSVPVAEPPPAPPA